MSLTDPNPEVVQGDPGTGAQRWPVAVTDTSDTVVRPGDATNDAIRVNIVAGSASGAAQADRSSFTDGTTSMTPIGGVFNDTFTSPTEDQAAAVRITAARSLHTTLRDEAGDSVMDGTNNAVRVNVVAGGSSATPSTTGTLTQVSATTSSTTILASNSNRLGALIHNNSHSRTIYIAFTSSSSRTAYSLAIGPRQTYNLDVNYTGVISGIWDTGTPSPSFGEVAMVTEFTA